jgi:hypothetical protein
MYGMATKSTSTPLKGRLLCVTVNSSSREGETSSASDAVSYNDMKRMIEELGGKISSTVHKKVDFLVASENAVASATQRIRKAEKYSVPVVRMGMIDHCYINKSMPTDMSKFVFANISELKENTRASGGGAAAASVSVDDAGDITGSSRKKRKAETVASGGNGVSYEPFEFKSSAVFECACICHDHGEPSCSWCQAAHAEHQHCAPAADSTPATTAAGDVGESGKKQKKEKKHRKSKE